MRGFQHQQKEYVIVPIYENGNKTVVIIKEYYLSTSYKVRNILLSNVIPHTRWNYRRTSA
jgi:hypothetical protein